MYLIYKAIIGAYISIITEAIYLVSNVVALIYYEILKKEKPILSYFNFIKKSKNNLPQKNENDAIETESKKAVIVEEKKSDNLK